MEGFKGTPGPWHIRSKDVGSVGTDSQMVHICMNPIDVVLGMTDEDEGNVNLIAAAPELLEALQEAMKFSMSEEAYNKCAAAVSKALGQ